MTEYEILERDSEGQVMTVAHVFATGLGHAMDQASFEQLHKAASVEIWHRKRRIAVQVNGKWRVFTQNYLMELGK